MESYTESMEQFGILYKVLHNMSGFHNEDFYNIILQKFRIKY